MYGISAGPSTGLLIRQHPFIYCTMYVLSMGLHDYESKALLLLLPLLLLLHFTRSLAKTSLLNVLFLRVPQWNPRVRL